MTKKKEKQKLVRVTLVKSPIGYEKSQGDTVRALGLRKMNATVELPDNSTVRGQINKVRHLLKVEEV
ncbi:MAG TPA: 50S ribosomal protein L30 [Oceanobacillus sp.]|nr:50S ribosomal protein L30 [Oceanobacillus sp.]